jgi:hypothetical protein
MAPPFLASALDGELSALRPDRFTAQVRDSGAHWVGGSVGPRAGLDAVHICIRDLLGWCVGWDTDYPERFYVEFLRPSRQIPG